MLVPSTYSAHKHASPPIINLACSSVHNNKKNELKTFRSFETNINSLKNYP